MRKGRALGGPLAGILLTALATWDGFVLRKQQRTDRPRHYHEGAYKWNGETWEWDSNVPPPPPIGMGKHAKKGPLFDRKPNSA